MTRHHERRDPPDGAVVLCVDEKSQIRLEQVVRQRAHPIAGSMLGRVGDQEIRAKLERHWQTAGATDQDAAHEIYREDCVVEWPQSGERICGKANLQALRTAYPAQLAFSVRRILGGGDLWITEYAISYDGNPVNVVSIMEFQGGLVARETHYFADPFEPPEWRAQWVELM